jgi:predicted dehydrogenase
MLLAILPEPNRQVVHHVAQFVGATPLHRMLAPKHGIDGRAQRSYSKPTPSCRIVAICDVDQGPAEATRASLSPPPDIYTVFRRMLERKDIDAVIVATPNHWHDIPALQAMRAGKDVYLEKPIGHTVEEGEVLIAEATRSGQLLEVGLQQRAARSLPM